MKKYRKISESSLIKKQSNKNLLGVLLKTKKFLQNNNNFSKKTNETEESDIIFANKKSRNELPKLSTSKNITPLDNNKIINFANPTILSRKSLNSLLFNSMSFDNFLKEVADSRVFGNAKDILPPILPEEKKDFAYTNIQNDSLSNGVNISEPINKKPKLPITEKFNSNTRKYLFVLDKLDELSLYQRNSILNRDKFINEDNKEEKYSISRNVILREIILNEISYKDLYHEEDHSLMDPQYYNKFIKSKIKEYKKEIPNEENFHRTLEKEYLDSEYNKPILTLNSLSITFTCKGKYHLFHIPFEFLPLFYYQNMEYLKLILISIVRFQNDFEDIYIDFEEIPNILSSSKQFELDENKIERRKPKDKYLEKAKLLKSTRTIIRNNLNSQTNDLRRSISRELFLRKNSNLKQSLKKNNTIRIFNGIKASPQYPKHNNEVKIYKCTYNKFIYKWNTPKYEYDVEIKVPEAIFQIGKTSLRAYIDIEHIFNFLENDFDNWDYYVSKIIFSYKECSHYLNEIISLKTVNKLSLKKSNSQPNFTQVNTRDIKHGSNKANRNIFLNMEKILKISEKSKIYEFLYTDTNNANYIKILHNFSVSSRCKSFKIKNKFIFDFNFSQMRILNKVLRIQGLNFFIKKLIYIDKFTSNLRFGYEELDSMANGDYNLLEKQNPNKDSYQTCMRMKEIYKDIINITVTFPFLETVRYNNQNYQNCFESDYNNVIFNGFSLDVLDELCHKNFDEWSKILINMKM